MFYHLKFVNNPQKGEGAFSGGSLEDSLQFAGVTASPEDIERAEQLEVGGELFIGDPTAKDYARLRRDV